MSQYLDLKRPIQVRSGDYRQTFLDAIITSVSLDQVGEDEGGKPIMSISFSVDFPTDGGCQHVADAFGFNRESWRYTDTGKSCAECTFFEKDGGDPVPYDLTTVNLPECRYCVCPDVSEDDIDAYCEATDFGKTCPHFQKKD